MDEKKEERQSKNTDKVNPQIDLDKHHTEAKSPKAVDSAPNVNIEEAAQDEKAEKAVRRTKPFKIFGGICIVAFIIGIILTRTSTVDTSAAAQNALLNKTSTALSAGTILLQEDANIGAADYTIIHQSTSEKTKIQVWDYAAQDGDYVQILVNGAPVSEPFMIKHRPKEFTVPSVGTVQVKGIKDGGGGITYAVRYDLNGTIYFNSTPEGELNTYTLVLGQ